MLYIALSAARTPLRVTNGRVVIVNQRSWDVRLARYSGNSGLSFSDMCPIALDADERES